MNRITRSLIVALAALVGLAGTWAVEPPAPAGAVAPYYDANGSDGTIYRLYRAYFLREPDTAGFAYWSWVYAGGYPLAQVSNDFAKSHEFQSRYGNVDNRGFLDLVYRNVLGRTPDQGGYDYWLDQMNRGMTRGHVMINFSDSAEFRSKTATGVPPAHRAGSNARTLLDVLAVAAEPTRSGYSRDLFKHWDDVNANGCDTRCEVLAAERRTDGTWFSLWDGYTTPHASELHIDHVVALAEAWDSGASTWNATKRDQFADWQVNLVAVTATSNQSKSDKDAAAWSPARSQSKCVFAELTVITKYRWQLSIDTAEKNALANMLNGCTKISSDAPPASAPPPPTSPPPSPGCSTDGIYTAANGVCVASYQDASGDVDCGQLPAATKPVRVHSPSNDPYRLDSDGDGVGCESG
jgi:hypothetical protein